MFFRGTVFAYDAAVESVQEKVKLGFIDSDKDITHTFSEGYSHDLVAKNFSNLEHRFKKTHQSYLRELLLVKLVSILEVFFSDITREILVSRKDMLKHIYLRRGKEGDNHAPKFSNDQLLSLKAISDVENKLIAHESRAISNKSFAKLEKYFKENLKIDFEKFIGDTNSLEKAYHTRNLLVHRLGRTDLEYRLSNKTGETKVTVSKRFLIKLAILTQEFAEFVSSEAERLISWQATLNIHDLITCIADISVEPLSKKGTRVLQRDYRFVQNDQLFLLKDFWHGYVTDEDIFVLNVRGRTKEIKAYLKALKQHKRSGDLRIIRCVL